MAIGGALGLVWAPCAGPLMAPVIAAAVVQGPSLEGLVIGGAYVLGALVPIGLIAALGRRVTRRVDVLAVDRLRRVFGAGMVVVSIVVLTGSDLTLAAGLTAALPDLGATIAAPDAGAPGGSAGEAAPRPSPCPWRTWARPPS